MRSLNLSDYFVGVAAKRLSAVETDTNTSHQHEFNGINGFKRILGELHDPVRYPTRLIYVSDDADEAVVDDRTLTWYDSRANHPTRSEYRLYFPTCQPMEMAAAGDLLVLGLRPDRTLLAVIAMNGSTVENQLLWLFDLDAAELDRHYIVRSEVEVGSRTSFAEKLILEALGVEIDDRDEMFLEEMLRRFNGRFPSTGEFSQYARSTLQSVLPLDDPDSALVEWIDREETLFRTLEKHFVDERLKFGFDDTDSFIAYSLSVHNRRKSRAGRALENHLATIFETFDLRFDHGKETENRAKPDFLFPGASQYHDEDFPVDLLTVLGAKSTCKDRWRQVLSEAAKIRQKHLFTLEPGISENQTNEMRANDLQLIVPATLHPTFSPAQQEWLGSLRSFIDTVQQKQRKAFP